MEKFSASLLEGRIVFGKYPAQEEVDLLKENGYSIFVDLTTSEEITWTPYSKEGIFYNRLPIPDRSANVGDILVFRELIRRLAEVVQHGYKVYIHCKGGHGRSAMFAGVLYGKTTNLSGIVCLREVALAHGRRTEMKPQFRKLGAPQTVAQKKFVTEELQ